MPTPVPFLQPRDGGQKFDGTFLHKTPVVPLGTTIEDLQLMTIREATQEDFAEIWPIFNEIVSAGETYAYPRGTTKDEASKIWLTTPRRTFVFTENGNILGTYYLKTNQCGQGNHVCNCGYMVSSKARGRGMATAMCEHSQKIAIQLGYKAMQFNFVASSNVAAIRLWNKLGFQTVGHLPGAFNHPVQGYIDALVMYKWLQA
jgi:L-amino acid N-acyltransferase YncA